ncbi:hypothetical protein GCM10011594_04610 [Nakamurella endophytica]|uniref:Uncharacterized protein n=1 Tax=Nakamurella endophytica TaxID=1748367 RepID=A0A917SNI6_9ACTN|nr:hypothetical protein GCM10011594_04610 [Nakamurella endophytica]
MATAPKAAAVTSEVARRRAGRTADGRTGMAGLSRGDRYGAGGVVAGETRCAATLRRCRAVPSGWNGLTVGRATPGRCPTLQTVFGL